MKVGIYAGTFDLLHPGHVMAIQYAKTKCDELIIALHVNPSIERNSKNSPIQSVFERFVQLAGLAAVDKIIPYETEYDLENMYGMLEIDVRFLGEEYKSAVNTGDDICNRLNITTEFIPRNHNYSSSNLRLKVYDTIRKD